MLKKTAATFLLCLCLVFLLATQAFAVDTDLYTRSHPWVTTLIHQVAVTNPHSQTIYNIKIQVPLMDNQLPVYQELMREAFSPQPVSINTQSDGTRTATYTIPVLKPGASVTLEQRFVICTYALSYNFNPWELPAESALPSTVAAYLQSETNVQVNNVVMKGYVAETVGSETNPYYIARRLFADINLYLNYQQSPQPSSSALEVLVQGVAQCEGYTNLYLATLRTAGIPAKRQYGYHYSLLQDDLQDYQKANGNLDANDMAHTWPEFYLADIGWVFTDPTFTYTLQTADGELKLVDWDRFARIASQQKYIFFSKKWGTDDHNDSFPYTYTGPKPAISFDAEIAFGAQYSPFTDIENSWAKGDILALCNAYPNLLTGETVSEFKPDNNLTRAETAALLNRCNISGPGSSAFYLNDVPTSHWAYLDIYKAQAQGFMSGYPGGTFHPNAFLTRGELAAVLVRSFHIPLSQQQSPFTDLNQEGYAWAIPSIQALYANGLVSGTGATTFAPQEPVSRAQMAAILNRMMHSTFYSP